MPPKTAGSAFSGTAHFYASYRPPYPNELLARLRLAAGTTGNGVLLDLACGPGRIAIPMAPHVRRVVAVDVEPEMIAVGEEIATRSGATNIDWRVSVAEQLELPPASVVVRWIALDELQAQPLIPPIAEQLLALIAAPPAHNLFRARL